MPYVKCSDAFPGSMSYEQLTAQIDALDYCTKGKVVMTDKAFATNDRVMKRDYIATTEVQVSV